MPKVTVTRHIHASVETVFQAVAHIEGLPDTSKDIARIEFLTEQREGVGTRFRETRMFKGQEILTDLEVTEFDPPHGIRMVADSHGTVWDTVFSVAESQGGAQLTIIGYSHGYELLAKIRNGLFKGLYKRGMEKHVDQLKAYCEGRE